MYFLTNKENYIIAASSDFLTTIGSRDVCSISAMLQNKLITLEDNKLSIPNKDLEYECNISTMYSAFGNLNLYTLATISDNSKLEEEATLINKLQDTATEKKDNEYDIPDIPSLHKSESTKVEEIESEKESLENIQTIHNETVEATNEDKESNKEIDNETIKTEDLEVSEDKEKTEEPENNELIEILKSIDTDNNTNEKLLNISTDNSIDKLADELIEKENKEEITNSDNTSIETTHNIDKIIEHSTVDNEIINQLEETNEKENGLKKITKKLFPWSNKKSQTIELEEEDNTPYEIDLKSASELEDKTKNSTTKDSIITNEAIIEKEDIKIPEIPSIAIEQEKIDNEKENISIDNKLELNNELEPKVTDVKPQEELLTIKNDEIEIPQTASINLEEEPENISTNNTNSDIELLEKIEVDTDKDKDKINLENKDINLEKTMNVETTTDNNNEINTLKEEISAIDTEEKDSNNQNNLINTQDIETENIENNSITYKVIKLQVENIDFEKNANKLSIDKSSYKMLLTNYLEEIEKYNKELENGTTSTIDMLQDAGKLLSLDLLTKRLGELKSEGDRVSLIKEISLISSLLKEKIDKKLEKTKTYEEPKAEEPEVKEEEISIHSIPDDIIDITSAQELLTSINPQSVSFNPNRAAEELNLPKTLIIEFIEDFIAQSKEHLPVLVEAYKKEDIKTIQTTAHMLKGAASNLRLDTIAENLFKIQKESNLNNSAELIKQFVAKLKGLSSEVASLEDAEDEN